MNSNQPILPSPFLNASEAWELIPSLKIGALEVRLARNEADLTQAQKLRYHVFYEEMGAKATETIAQLQKDVDDLDAFCDHLLVIDHDKEQTVVGTYRLIRREAATRYGRFYSAAEFDISKIENRPEEILELGRSCVQAPYRTQPTLHLLWCGIAQYMMVFNISLLFGSASFSGTDLASHEQALSYLYYFHMAPKEYRAKALSSCYVPMNRIQQDLLDWDLVQKQIPPLLKGYLRVGGVVGDGAVIDHAFNTVDVCILVKADLLPKQYVQHYLKRRMSKGGKDVL